MEERAYNNSESGQEFTLTEGGPGGAVLRRLRLVRPELGMGSARTALILMVIVWAPLCVLCLIEGLAVRGAKLPFFYDLAAHARFLLAVPVMILADIPVGVRLRQVVRHFLEANLVREEDLARFEKILGDTLRFRDARAAELLVLALAYIATYNAVSGFASQGGSTWFMPDPARGLTLGGYWYAFVALPIFQFLIFRWVHRMVVWSSFLWKVSKLDLRLTPTHPDTAGGLAFLGKGLIPFGAIFFALSAVVSSAIAGRILFSGGKLEDFEWSYVSLFVVGLLVFAGPTLIFVPKLMMLKNRGLMEYGTLASQYTQAFHSRWIEQKSEPSTSMLGTADIQSLADLGNSFEIIRKMRIVPVEPSDFVAMVLPGLIPALPLAATVMPLGTIVTGLIKLVV